MPTNQCCSSLLNSDSSFAAGQVYEPVGVDLPRWCHARQESERATTVEIVVREELHLAGRVAEKSAGRPGVETQPLEHQEECAVLPGRRPRALEWPLEIVNSVSGLPPIARMHQPPAHLRPLARDTRDASHQIVFGFDAQVLRPHPNRIDHECPERCRNKQYGVHIRSWSG